MFSSFFKSYFIGISTLLIISIIFCSFIPSVFPNSKFKATYIDAITTIISDGTFSWPTPGYNTITSPFGKRSAPTSGASTFHSGVDIGAPAWSNIVAVCSGRVTFLGFSGAGGFTITITGDTFTTSYCHVSPDFIVYVGQNIKQGQAIGKVGPKNVYGVPNNPYKDTSGNPTNGATTGPHLHLTIRKDGKLVNPLDYIS